MENFKTSYHFSDSDLDALKSGEIDRIIPVFTYMDIPIFSEFVSLAIRNIIRFISTNTILQKAYKTEDYRFDKLACQKAVGDHDIFLGIAGKNRSLLKIANPFAKENFIDLNEDAFDSICEFINCTNGLYASKLSRDNILLTMSPPHFYHKKKLISNGELFVIPIIIEGEQADLIAAVDSQVEIV